MFRAHSHRFRAVLSAAAVVAVGLIGLVGPLGEAAAAQTDTAFDENETEGTIDRVRLQLLGVAAVTGALLVGYVWHTDPQRRQRVADRRRDERELAAIAALDEEFVLPGDVEVDPPEPDGAAAAEAPDDTD